MLKRPMINDGAFLRHPSPRSSPSRRSCTPGSRLKQIRDLVVYLQLVLSQFKLLLEVRIYNALFVHPKSRILRQQPAMGFVFSLLMEWPCRRRAKYGPSHAERHDFVGRDWCWLGTKWLRMRGPDRTFARLSELRTRNRGSPTHKPHRDRPTKTQCDQLTMREDPGGLGSGRRPFGGPRDRPRSRT